jgi:hypothetical protein
MRRTRSARSALDVRHDGKRPVGVKHSKARPMRCSGVTLQITAVWP